MGTRPHLIVFALAMVAGFVFASFSTYDFAQHLDRQVHDLHCSFVPGLTEGKATEASGCQATLMSPYSSVLRQRLWGGIPISLPAMGVFAFLLYRSLVAMTRPVSDARAATGSLLAFSLLPVGASLVMGAIAFLELDAACKLCIGIYGASLVGLLAAGLAFSSARRDAELVPVDGPPATTTFRELAIGTVELGGFVLLPVMAYALMIPDHARFIGSCGELEDRKDPYGVLLSLEDAGPTEVLEVLDPLCPTCRAFEHRLQTSGLHEKIHRRVLLFPLDEACNWNVTASVHPGACTVSEAMLCAAERPGVSAGEVLAWAFEHQDELLATGKRDPAAVGDRVRKQFPGLAQCVGSPAIASKLNKSLRWAVSQSLPVLTPQIYVEGTRVCGEDTDLGLDYTLARMLEDTRHGGAR